MDTGQTLFGIAFLQVIFLLIIRLVISVLISVWIYRDAKSRGMNAALWVVLTIFTSQLVVVIIYLFARKDKQRLICPRCSSPVEGYYSVCPSCSQPLHNNCPQCSTPLSPGWRVCPNCSAPVTSTNSYNYRQAEEVKKPKSTGFIVAIVVLALAGVVLLASVGSLVFNAAIDGDWSEFYEEVDPISITKEEITMNYPSVSKWITECDNAKEGSVFLLADDDTGAMLLYTKKWIDKNDAIKFERVEEGLSVTMKFFLPPSQSEKDIYNISYFESFAFSDEVEVYSGSERLDVVVTLRDVPFMSDLESAFSIENIARAPA